MKIEEKRVNEKEKDKKIMKSDDRFHEDNLRNLCRVPKLFSLSQILSEFISIISLLLSYFFAEFLYNFSLFSYISFFLFST